jgi:small subunit ribosomal protein S16
MSVVIRLKREGRKNLPSYRIHVTDVRSARDGASIEKLGFYDPRAHTPEKQLQFDRERARYWVEHGASVSETVASIFRRHKVLEGLPKAPKRDRSGRSARTKTSERREAAKASRSAAKAARPAHRRKPKAPPKKQGAS